MISWKRFPIPPSKRSFQLLAGTIPSASSLTWILTLSAPIPRCSSAIQIQPSHTLPVFKPDWYPSTVLQSWLDLVKTEDCFPTWLNSLRRTLFSSEPVGVVGPNRDGWTVEMLDWAVLEHQSQKRRLNPSESWRFLQGSGTRRGHLIGGCFEVLDWLRGTSFWPQPGDWENAILFLETSEDAPSPDAVMYGLRTFAALGVLHKLSGILFARPGGQIPPEKFKEYDEAILRVVSGEEGLGDLPVVTNMDFGHTDPMFVIPYGIEAEIDCKEQQFSILESAVSI